MTAVHWLSSMCDHAFIGMLFWGGQTPKTFYVYRLVPHVMPNLVENRCTTPLISSTVHVSHSGVLSPVSFSIFAAKPPNTYANYLYSHTFHLPVQFLQLLYVRRGWGVGISWPQAPKVYRKTCHLQPHVGTTTHEQVGSARVELCVLRPGSIWVCTLQNYVISCPKATLLLQHCGCAND